MITKDKLSGMIDHTNLKANVSEADMKKLCEEAVSYGFAMVAVNSGQSNRCAQYLKDTPVHVGAAIGFPLGQTTIAVKVFETEDAILNGADEIDYLINITELKAKHYDYIKEEMQRIVDVCRKHHVISKVIFENCYLTKDEIIKMCEIANEVKPDFIKTSTGFGTSGATLEDVRLMRKHANSDILVKAAGGIRSLETALAFVEAGAQRIGTSCGIAIIDEM